MTRKKLLIIAISLILIVVIISVVLLLTKSGVPGGSEPPPTTEAPNDDPNDKPNDNIESVIFTVTYDYGNKGEGVIADEAVFSTQVELNKPFSLIVPFVIDTRFVFEGWFDPSGRQFTNEQGSGLFNWDIKSDITLYAHWIEAFEFMPIGDGYIVSCGAEIDKLSNITIPLSYNSLPVIAVGDFKDCHNLMEVHLPQSIKIIISRAFYNCTKLTIVEFERGCKLNSIGTYAFYLSGIEDIDIPSSITEIGAYAFSRSAIRSVTFKESNMTRLSESLFRDCENLTEAIFEGGKLTAIGEYAFANSGVQKIVLPPLLTDIDGSSFSGCNALRSVTLSSAYGGDIDAFSIPALEEIKVPSDNLFYSDIDGVLFDKACATLIMYPAGRCNDTYTIPASVIKLGIGVFNKNVYLQTINFAENCIIDSIEENTFAGCTSLVNITLPDSVKSIGARAFYNCTSLINFDFAALLSIGDEAFKGCSSIKEVKLPSSLIDLGASAFAECDSLNEVVFEEESSLINLKSSVFSGCKSLEVIEIPKSVISIGLMAFGCTSLKSITVPTNVVSIGKNAFYGCEGLKTVVFDDSSELSTIESGTFSGCSSLAEITLPSGLKKIAYEAFKDCISLKGLTLPSSLTSIGESAFENCIGLNLIIVPNNIKTLPSYIFKNCISLKKIAFDTDNKLTTIGDSAFKDCASLTDIVLPLSLTSIKTNAFSGCTKLSELIIPSNVMNIERNALMGVENIIVSPENSYIYIDGGVLYGKTKDVITTMHYSVSKVDSILQIPDSVTTIESNALSGTDLSEVVIPQRVTEMGESAFKDCTNLTKVTFAPQSGLTKISKSVFEGCGSLSEITVPINVTIIEAYAFRDCGLKQITFAEGLISIGEGAFKNSSISKIELCSSIQNIGAEAFSGCDKLTHIVLPEGLSTIETSLFSGCVSLTQVLIPSNITKIKSGAFDGCTSIANITIPASITEIESGAFNNWTYEQTINVPFAKDKLPSGWIDWNIGCNANIVFV
ncbi:MAG: leucine-rich repeat domain-containing protein [Clostridiales bacterium]|nr:leucine-rich repeat domain-containing protein [Clostridiales bacterium]